MKQDDIAIRFSKALDELPGFRARNSQPPMVSWIQANNTRKTAVYVAGAGVVAGLLAALSKRGMKKAA